MEQALLELSPSSASDFKSCPLKFKFRSIDRLVEPTSSAAARGSLVHAVLERLFAEAPECRTPQRAEDLLVALWTEVRHQPEVRPSDLIEAEEQNWLAVSKTLLGNYFKLEDPSLLHASRLEWWVEYELADLHLRGVIDRVEETPDGAWILTDYKTGRIPGEMREATAFFGLRFYALVCWRAFGVIPKEIRLVYLANPSVLTLTPHERMLSAFEKQMLALGKAIRRANDTDDWRPSPSPLCMSCSFQSLCPAWAGAAAGPQADAS
ncbi:MAG: RecB family exonuclease [Actinomycetota bacterium]